MSEAPAPELSVIIATHNRRELLRRCLESLSAQTQDPATFEVIVADDGSGDGSAEMAAALSPPFPYRVLALPKRGHSATQNAAIEIAEAATCLLLDDDVIASPELVAAHIEAHREIPAAIGIGAITQKPPSARDWYAHTHARSWNAHYEEFAFREAHWTDCYGANLSMPRWALVEVGGVSTEVPKGKDLDLAFRLCQAGCAPTYVPRAQVVHDDQKRRPRMLEDAAREGAMHLELSRRHPERAEALLDWSDRAGSKELLLRRLLIGLRVPPASLALAGPLVPGPERELLWYSIVRRFAFWRGVRRSVSRHTWVLVTHNHVIEAIAERLQ
jgi:GT2 family glycosyltransferase